MIVQNLFDGIPQDLPHEIVDTLAIGHRAKIERIVSKGHSSSPGFWYDQDEDEWVVLLKGKADLEFEGQASITTLGPGDHILIPAHIKHRVRWTDPDQECIWIAVYF
ncbi:MAG: cupin domain-containing protein [Chloroflexota bacterium]|nr:cupin domain-containing protein [Chloroflexota bacterium]